MTTHRFFIEQTIDGGVAEIADQELLKQWQKVLRLEKGDRLNLIDKTGLEVVAIIERMDKNQAVLEIIERLPAKSVKTAVHLVVAILKKENFEWVVQKATEIGVASITPLISERTVKLGLNEDRLLKIIQEAGEQSGRQIKPVLHPSITFTDWLSGNKNGAVVALSLNGKENVTLNNKEEVTLLIGPEGGWSGDEEILMRSKEINLRSLGDLVLRAETAAVVGAYLAVSRLI